MAEAGIRDDGTVCGCTGLHDDEWSHRVSPRLISSLPSETKRLPTFDLLFGSRRGDGSSEGASIVQDDMNVGVPEDSPTDTDDVYGKTDC